MDALAALELYGGAARWKELIDAGVTRRGLAAAVASGAAVRRIFGTYSLPATPEPVWLAAAFHAFVTCVSWCAASELPLLRRPTQVHLLVPESRGLRSDDTRPTRRVVMHRSDAAWREIADNPCAVAVDLASRCVDRHAQLALVDAALYGRQLYPGSIRDFLHTPPAQRKWLIDHCDHEAQSIMETYPRVWLTEAGFKVVPQVVVGPRGHRDLLVEDLVIVQTDGYESHGNKVAFREDRWLDRMGIHAGKPTLRYTFADLFGSDRADLVADVTAALNLVRKSA